MRTAMVVCALLLLPALTFADYSVPKDAKFTVTDVKVSRVVGVGKENTKEFSIGAAVRIPAGDKPEGGWPSVLFISGSGSQTRHGFQGKLDLGSWELLDAIADAGFLVLSSDDRGIGETPVGEEGCKPTEVGYDELVGDARACLTYLQGRDDVNKKKIFIIGHSEGGLTAPILAGDNEIAGVVFMAGAGRNMYDVTLNQVEDSIASQPQAQRDVTMKVQREFQDAVKEGRDPDWNIAGTKAAGQLKITWKSNIEPIKEWWHDHFNLDVPAIHAAVSCPCLVANGLADFQVNPEKDAKQIVKDLLAGRCSDVTLKLYDDLDHLFKPCGGRKSKIEMYFEDRRVSAAYVKDVVRWLTERK